MSKLDRAKTLIEFINKDTVTQAEFLKNFKILVDFVKDTGIKLDSKLDKSLIKALNDLDARNTELISSVKDDNDADFNDIKKSLSKELETLIAKVNKKLGEVKSGKDGLDGKNGVDGKDGTNGSDGKDTNPAEIIDKIEKDLPQLGTAVRDGLELLQGDERLDVSAIKGIEELLKELNERISKIPRGRVGGTPTNTVQIADLTSQCDGVTKTFTTPGYRMAVSLQGTQFPVIYRPTIDYTLGNKSITLTDEVSAPDTLQTLLFAYIK